MGFEFFRDRVTMDLTDEELTQHIKNAEAALLALKKERMAREVKRAEALLPEFTVKAQQYFGLTARVKVETDQYDLQGMLVVEIPTGYDDAFRANEEAFYEDPEVLDKYCSEVFVHTRFVHS